jgi:predicted secreted protein
LNDVVFQFDDRTNSTKQLQFTGSGPLQAVGSSEATEVIALGSYTKGQFVRLFLGSDNTAAPSTVIGAARTLSLHVSLQMESATTKDTTGEWDIQEPTALNYDISTGALVRSGETITSQVGAKSLADLETIYEAGTPVKWKIANVGGDNNRTASSTIVSGSVVLTQLAINGPNRQNADYTATLNGYGEYTVAA